MGSFLDYKNKLLINRPINDDPLHIQEVKIFSVPYMGGEMSVERLLDKAMVYQPTFYITFTPAFSGYIYNKLNKISNICEIPHLWYANSTKLV